MKAYIQPLAVQGADPSTCRGGSGRISTASNDRMQSLLHNNLLTSDQRQKSPKTEKDKFNVNKMDVIIFKKRDEWLLKDYSLAVFVIYLFERFDLGYLCH